MKKYSSGSVKSKDKLCVGKITLSITWNYHRGKSLPEKCVHCGHAYLIPFGSALTEQLDFL